MAGKKVKTSKTEKMNSNKLGYFDWHFIFGWLGQGIGKHLDGIAKPVKASLKFNSDGLGYDQSIEYNNHWWQNAYNDAAKNIQVENASTNGEDVSMKLKNGESIEVCDHSNSESMFIERKS